MLKIFWYVSRNYTKFFLKIFSKISKKFIFEYLSIPILKWNWKTYEWRYLINVTKVTLRTWGVGQWRHCCKPMTSLFELPLTNEPILSSNHLAPVLHTSCFALLINVGVLLLFWTVRPFAMRYSHKTLDWRPSYPIQYGAHWRHSQPGFQFFLRTVVYQLLIL